MPKAVLARPKKVPPSKEGGYSSKPTAVQARSQKAPPLHAQAGPQVRAGQPGQAGESGHSSGRAAPRHQARGLRTREAILARAVDIASVQGLEGLTVGSLAEELKMSKSGLFAHFGSKEDLQLATIETAREIFIQKVTRPAIAARKGMPRLWGLLEHWLNLVEKNTFSGGCFFSAASFEFDSRRGPVRDRIAAIMHEWIAVITRAVYEAQKAGHLEPKVDPTRLAFEIHALAMGAHWAHQLLDDQHAYSRARTTVLEKLRSVATPECPRLP